MAPIALLALMAVMGYFLLIRPARLNNRARAAMMEELAEGRDVLTVGGVYGRVVGLRDEDLDLEVADGVVVRVNRRAIAAVEGGARVPPEGRDLADEPGAGDRTDADAD